MFVDHIKIYAKAGDGGDGSASFRREKYVPRGGPDGGDGGNGADVVLLVDQHTDNLNAFFYRPKYKAPHGENGMRFKKTGRSGKALVLKVPPGTLVYREPEESVLEKMEGSSEIGGEQEESMMVSDQELVPGDRDPQRELVADLTAVGDRFVLSKGGIGGKGNVHFKSPTNQVPEETTPGTAGEEGTFYLELQRIADAGFVGFPNAGKSTLLGTLSAAKPKVAAYPFTTLRPMVGVVEFPGFSRATVADIPGLIEGAHENVGLGHDFLRHIMRCRLLIFVTDTAGSEGRDPVSDIVALRTEISLYDNRLAKQPWLIVANKMDLEESAEQLEALRSRFPRQEIIPVSALENGGIDLLKARLHELIGKAPE